MRGAAAFALHLSLLALCLRLPAAHAQPSAAEAEGPSARKLFVVKLSPRSAAAAAAHCSAAFDGLALIASEAEQSDALTIAGDAGAGAVW